MPHGSYGPIIKLAAWSCMSVYFIKRSAFVGVASELNNIATSTLNNCIIM